MYTRNQLFACAVVGGVALTLGLFLLAHAAPPACSAWASPQGSGSACSEASPCNVGTWLSSKAAPGGVLCMQDGIYKGDSQMLQFSGKNGTAGNPITVRALNDGKVEVNGEHQRRPLDCNASYITVQGLNVRDGNDTTLTVRGQHCTIQRVVAWSTQPADGGIENIVDIGGNHNLLEDLGSFGFARKTLAIGARGGVGPNTVRRAWVEHNGSPYGSAEGNPTDPVDQGYNQDASTLENVIGRRNILTSATEPEAPLHVYSTRNSALLGSIVYATNQDNIETSMMLNITAESGSHSGSGHVTTNFLLQDVVLLAAPVHEHLRGYQIDGGSGSSGNVAKRVIAVAPQGGGSCGSGGGWDCSELHSGRTLAEALKGKTIYELAPGTCYRYVNRQLTNEPLWPWPMTQRIQAALESARMPTRNVTKHVAQTFGEPPPQCGGSGLVPPAPSPGVPVPPTAVTAVLQGTSVLISWTDITNANATGYTVERKVGTGGYIELSTAPGADARTYLDRTPAAAQQNCYVVYARGVAGPSGFSPEACVQGPGTTPPPGPDRTPLTCEGVLGEGGVIRLRCQPQAGSR